MVDRSAADISGVGSFDFYFVHDAPDAGRGASQRYIEPLDLPGVRICGMAFDELFSRGCGISRGGWLACVLQRDAGVGIMLFIFSAGIVSASAGVCERIGGGYRGGSARY